jgi:hypothetical protein
MYYVEYDDGYMCPEGHSDKPVSLSLSELIETLKYCQQEKILYPTVKTGYC